ncbi:hypothetical protein [Micromonospora ureilytica]|uniref:Alpha-beta hydrolase superfamily lysophospholipase n=1 Tax=Micromonospora ureilytica TaxID=709868 RepID=A0ABS0JID5_9ACTN|nr:hypothetical protein [Micromonospora ureilytica]MBG6066831.1 alpha-beta hydrolase superfamily lysophospholipase [Micromonospora ureilytica]
MPARHACPAGTKSLRDETADLVAVIEAARRPSGRPVHLVGASYGATLALHTQPRRRPLSNIGEARYSGGPRTDRIEHST